MSILFISYVFLVKLIFTSMVEAISCNVYLFGYVSVCQYFRVFAKTISYKVKCETTPVIFVNISEIIFIPNISSLVGYNIYKYE